MEIIVENVNQALHEGLSWLYLTGIEANSRNGPVIVAPEPVMTIYTMSQERVLFSPLRDSNPFFSLLESLWMLAGREDVEFPAYFASNMRQYSDDGKVFHGAYGFRWRQWYGYDQLTAIMGELKRNPESRRCVLAMWDGGDYSNPALRNDHGQFGDLRQAISGGKDVPCNTHAYFEARDGRLNMTVLCRSNDVYWGAYGTNAVHFSVLLEYVAAGAGLTPGLYRQFSNNYHVYPAVIGRDHSAREQLRRLATDASTHNYYAQGKVSVFPLVSRPIEVWNEDLKKFFDNPERALKEYEDPFFFAVAAPMYGAWAARKRKRPLIEQVGWLDQMVATDWRAACQEWITRREAVKTTAAVAAAEVS